MNVYLPACTLFGNMTHGLHGWWGGCRLNECHPVNLNLGNFASGHTVCHQPCISLLASQFYNAQFAELHHYFGFLPMLCLFLCGFAYFHNGHHVGTGPAIQRNVIWQLNSIWDKHGKVNTRGSSWQCFYLGCHATYVCTSDSRKTCRICLRCHKLTHNRHLLSDLNPMSELLF